jgi:hypothetical protein
MEIFRDALQSVLSFSSDAMLIIALTTLGSTYAYIKGKEKGISLILSFYPSFLIFSQLPFFREYTASNPASSTEAMTQVGIFLVIFIPIHFILNRFVSADFSYSKLRKIGDSFILGLLTAGLVLLFSYHVVNIELVYNFSSGIDAFFLGNYYFWWLLAPFIAFFFLKKS